MLIAEPARGDPWRACGVVDELIMRALEGERLSDVFAGAGLAGEAVELAELLARLDEEMGLRRGSMRGEA